MPAECIGATPREDRQAYQPPNRGHGAPFVVYAYFFLAVACAVLVARSAFFLSLGFPSRYLAGFRFGALSLQARCDSDDDHRCECPLLHYADSAPAGCTFHLPVRRAAPGSTSLASSGTLAGLAASRITATFYRRIAMTTVRCSSPPDIRRDVHCHARRLFTPATDSYVGRARERDGVTSTSFRRHSGRRQSWPQRKGRFFTANYI
jgi:hypothetical protein